MIRELEIFNVGPFRGRHVLSLGPKAYAITARSGKDRSRSNGIGKSLLQECFRFAITGEWAKFRGYDADGWIAKNEREAFVKMTAEDGAVYERSRRRGQPTQVRFIAPDGLEASQVDAEEAMRKHLGFDPEDFSNVAYFAQGKMAKLVDPEETTPADRLAIVSGWLGLQLGDLGEERATEIASAIEKDLSLAIARRDSKNVVPPTIGPTVEEIEKTIASLKARVDALKADVAKSRLLDQAEVVVRQHEKLVEEGKSIKAKEVDFGYDELVVAEHAEAVLACRVAVDRAVAVVEQKRRVSLGQFDGRCPVANIDCPATRQINGDRSRANEEHDAAREVLADAEILYRNASAKNEPVAAARKERDFASRKLEELRAKVKESLPAYRAAKASLENAPEALDESGAADELEDAQSRLREASVLLGSVRQAEKQRIEDERERARLTEEVAKKTKEVMVAVRVKKIFREATRRVAERALRRVEEDANRTLREAEVDLYVQARWDREGKGPAKSCDECGQAFPASVKVKECSRCGSPRGQHSVQRLDFVLSDKSGALLDLGGVAMQMAAGAMLLAKRDSCWASVFLDEPFSQCDAHHRKRLAVQLVKMLGRGTWRQAFVISHSAEVVDVYPGKIEIVKHEDGSRSIEVSG